MTPEAGVTLSDNGVAGRVGVGSTGPGSGATPGIAGDVKTMGVVALDTVGAACFFTTGAVFLCFAGRAIHVSPMQFTSASNVGSTHTHFAVHANPD